MIRVSKQTLLKTAVLIGVGVFCVNMFKDKLWEQYVKFRLETNGYDSGREIFDDATYFGVKLMPEIIERISPEVNKGTPGRYYAEEALMMMLEGDAYDRSHLTLEFDSNASNAWEAYNFWKDWHDKNKDLIEWDPVEKKIRYKAAAE